MKEYDVFIAGGGIAGSIAAKYAAKGGLKVLFVEKFKTPREKSCSGIQFSYFEKILGEKIPKERLCTNEINRVSIHLPNGKSMKAPFKMFNFMRDVFDDWLNQVAIENGAEFRDECSLVDWEEKEDCVIVTVSDKDKNTEVIKTKYLIDATGMNSRIRKKMRPEDYEKRSSGATVNYYFDGVGDLDPKCLYQYWNMDFNNYMFAWVYNKSGLWVIGTGNDKEISKVGKKFFEFIKKEYNLEGEIVKTEGFSSNMDMSETRVHLGEGRILYIGDTAGLVDMNRGVGMDAAAISGRLAAKAIIKAENKNKKKRNALEIYKKLMKKTVNQTVSNTGKSIHNLADNTELMAYMKKAMVKMGVGMMFQNFFNKFRSGENLTLLPP
jgi:flavin-dependent dehydrogenase